MILAAVLCIAALSLLCINLFNGDGSTAVVEIDGKPAAELSLGTDTIYNVEIDGKITNTVVIENGSVYVTNSDCPDKICQNHSAINKTGESIVCLPNKVIVTVEGNTDTEIDGVAR